MSKKPKEREKIWTRPYDHQRLKDIARAFNLPQIEAITMILDDFQKKDKR